MSLRTTIRAALNRVPGPINRVLKLNAPAIAVVFRFGEQRPPVLEELTDAMNEDATEVATGTFRDGLAERKLFVCMGNDMYGSFQIEPGDENSHAVCYVWPVIEEDGRLQRSIDAPACGVAVTLTDIWEPRPARYGRESVALLMGMLEVLEPIVTQYSGSVRVNGIGMNDLDAARARVRELLDGWVDEQK